MATQEKTGNEYIWGDIGVKLIEEKMTKNLLRWFGHILRRPLEALERRIDCMVFRKGRKRDQGHWRRSLEGSSGE